MLPIDLLFLTLLVHRQLPCPQLRHSPLPLVVYRLIMISFPPSSLPPYMLSRPLGPSIGYLGVNRVQSRPSVPLHSLLKGEVGELWDQRRTRRKAAQKWTAVSTIR